MRLSQAKVHEAEGISGHSYEKQCHYPTIPALFQESDKNVLNENACY
jgi:hypothetical protein